MFAINKVARTESTPYATAEDFCRIFMTEMNSLFLLSFLLTGNQSLAEKCFIQGLEDSHKGNPVFRDWARSWARRTIIQNAIQIVRPRSTRGGMSNSTSNWDAHHTSARPAEIAALAALPAFERFVYVLSVLEHYSDQECSVLLGSARKEVVAARIRALGLIGSSAFTCERQSAALTTRAHNSAKITVNPLSINELAGHLMA